MLEVYMILLYDYLTIVYIYLGEKKGLYFANKFYILSPPISLLYFILYLPNTNRGGWSSVRLLHYNSLHLYAFTHFLYYFMNVAFSLCVSNPHLQKRNSNNTFLVFSPSSDLPWTSNCIYVVRVPAWSQFLSLKWKLIGKETILYYLFVQC